MAENKIPIPARVYNAAKGGYVCGATDVVDETTYPNTPTSQASINDAFDADINMPSSGLKHKVSALEDRDSIVIDGEGMLLTNDFVDIQFDSGKVPTANAVAGLGRALSIKNWIYLIVDRLDQILAGIKDTGEIEWAKGVPTPIKEYVGDTIVEALQADKDAAFLNSAYFIYTIIDAEGKVVAGIQKDGSIYVGHNISFSDKAMTAFLKTLKEAGFKAGSGGDLSDVKTNDGDIPVHIEMPRLASLNIVTDTNLSKLSKEELGGIQGYNYDVRCQVEFFDGKGVGFKKNALISAQGNSSIIFEKKNIGIDLFDGDVRNSKGKWGKGDGFSISFGEWVPQTSFHLKSYYTDFLRGSAVIAYQIADEIDKSRNKKEDRAWKRALVPLVLEAINQENAIEPMQFDDLSLLLDNGARCMPDGFPVIVYLNGEFYGIYSWQLKKDAANYHLDKENTSNIHLDGAMYESNFWDCAESDIAWWGFEIRCPKKLIDYNGNDYNGDLPTIPIDSTSPAWTNDKKQKNTLLVKNSIIKLTKHCPIIKNKITFYNIGNSENKYSGTIQSYAGTWLYNVVYKLGTCVFRKDNYYICIVTNSNKVPEAENSTYWVNITSNLRNYNATSNTPDNGLGALDLMEKYFDIDSLIDYLIANMVVDDTDGFGKNWQWITYDGIKWHVCEYDKDYAFGNHSSGMFLRTLSPYKLWQNESPGNPVGLVALLYTDRIKERWNELKAKGIITAEHVETLVLDWIKRIGVDNFIKEYEKWDKSPCNRDSGVNYEYWRYSGYANNVPWMNEEECPVNVLRVYNNRIYKSIQDVINTTTPPDVNTTDWEDVTWDTNKVYDPDSVLGSKDCWFLTLDPSYCIHFQAKLLIDPQEIDDIESTIPSTNEYYNSNGASLYPRSLGYKDSVWRFIDYIEQNLEIRNRLMDALN